MKDSDKIDLFNAMIEANKNDEAIMSIESIIRYPPNRLRIRCHLSKKFKLNLTFEDNDMVSLSNQYGDKIDFEFTSLLKNLKKMIYDTDETAIERGEIKGTPYASFIFPDNRPPAPEDMDIPVWDEERKIWYDAEY